MDTLGKRLKDARESAGITQAELAKRVHVNQSIIGSLESGHRKASSYIPAIADALGVNALWLSAGKGNRAAFGMLFNRPEILPHDNVSEKVPLRGRVPLISYVAAGNWSEAVDNFAPNDAEEWVSTTIHVGQHTYALRVQGDSMEPRFPDGAIIIVEPEADPKNGSFVIARQNGSEATFKQLIIDGGQRYLKPLNDRYPILNVSSDTVICGVVKQMVMDV